jgi:ssDNA thymidine ADP-ribosyltransferase, DarT
MTELTSAKAWIFRITHIENVSWILTNGLYCCNSDCRDPDFRQICNLELIAKRVSREVPIAPGGTLSDYVPFYFTPHSPMLLNIKTGYNGVCKTPMQDIVILATSLPKVNKEGLSFVFTDRHAYVRAARYFDSLEDLDNLDWPLLVRRDFSRDPEDPGKMERYMAEALIHQLVPVSALLGIACYGPAQLERMQSLVASHSLSIKVVARPDWYF